MSARFDASTEYMIRSDTTPTADPLTVCFRVHIDVDRNAGAVLCSLTRMDGSAYQAVSLRVNGTGLRVATHADGIDGSELQVGRWYHVAYVRNGSNFTLYLDGVQDATLTSAVSFTPQALLLGGNTVNWLNGRLQDVGIWSAALSQSEIAAEAASVGAPARTSNLWGYYRLVLDANDTSGNARHLTAAGAVTWEAGYQPVSVALATDIIAVAQPAVTVEVGSGAQPADVNLATDIVAIAQPSATVDARRSVSVALSADIVAVAQPGATVDARQAVAVSLAVDVVVVLQPSVAVDARQAVSVPLSVDAVAVYQPAVTVVTGGAVAVQLGVQVVALSQLALTVDARQAASVALGSDVVAVSQPPASVATGQGAFVTLGVQIVAIAHLAVTVVTGQAAAVALSVGVVTIEQPAVAVDARQVASVQLAADVIAVAQPAVTVTVGLIVVAATVHLRRSLGVTVRRNLTVNFEE
jgi:hypothetical protein